jgi:hypothetical protein
MRVGGGFLTVVAAVRPSFRTPMTKTDKDRGRITHYTCAAGYYPGMIGDATAKHSSSNSSYLHI